MERLKINISTAMRDAFKGFKLHWIVLCLFSSIILLTQSWIPKFIFNKIISGERNFILLGKLTSIKNTLFSGYASLAELKSMVIELYQNPQTSHSIQILTYKSALVAVILSLILCFLYIVIIYISNRKKNIELNSSLKTDILRSPNMSLSYLFLSFIKAIIFLIPFVIPFIYTVLILDNPSQNLLVGLLHLCILFLIFIFLMYMSIYLYLRLYFTGFIITEKSANPFDAIAKSWKLSKSKTLQLFVIFLITTVIDFISIISVIGFIPATGLKYTLRASAYQQALLIENGES